MSRLSFSTKNYEAFIRMLAPMRSWNVGPGDGGRGRSAISIGSTVDASEEGACWRRASARKVRGEQAGCSKDEGDFVAPTARDSLAGAHITRSTYELPAG